MERHVLRSLRRLTALHQCNRAHLECPEPSPRESVEQRGGAKPGGDTYARERHVRVKGARLRGNPDAREARGDFSLEFDERIPSGPDTGPERPRQPAWGEGACVLDDDLKRCERPRRPKRLDDRRRPVIVHRADEGERHVQAIGNDPGDPGARREPLRARPQFVHEIAGGANHIASHLDGDEEPHVAVSMRRTMSSAAWDA